MNSVDDLIRHRDAWDEPHAFLKSLVESGDPIDVATTRRIHTRFGPTVGPLITQSAELHDKSRRKFGSGTWWATQRSLQQSTPQLVAQLKSQWLPPPSRDDGSVVDLCCGIGGDAIEIARRHPVTLVDRDPLILAAAVGNVHQAGGSINAAILGDAQSTPLSDRGWHIDPDRRATSGFPGTAGSGEKRTTRAEEGSPPWSWITAQFAIAPAALVKLAPAAKIDPASFPKGVSWHRAWISTSSGVVEQTVLAGVCLDGADVRSGEHSAWMVRQDQPVRRFMGMPRDRIESANHVGAFLADPDPSVRAAGLTATVGESFQMSALGGPAGFLTSDERPDDSFPGTTGQVIWSGSMDDRKLRREFRARGVFPQIIKARGIDGDVATLEKRYRELGTQPVTLWLGRKGKSRFAAMTSL